MNAASKILRALAIIGALAAGTFFFLTQGKVEDLNTKLASANSALATARQSDAADLAAAKDRAEKADADKATLASELQDAKKSNDDANDLLAQATSALNDVQKRLKAADSALAEKQNQIDDLQKKVSADESTANETDALKKQVTDLQKQVDDLKKNGPSPSSETADTGPGATPTDSTLLKPASPGEPTTIAAVNASVGLVVIAADLPKNTAVMLEASGTELGRGTVIDNQGGQAVVRIDSTGEMSVGDFFKIIKQGGKVDYALLK
jgi:hypothetical protein